MPRVETFSFDSMVDSIHGELGTMSGPSRRDDMVNTILGEATDYLRDAWNRLRIAHLEAKIDQAEASIEGYRRGIADIAEERH